MASNYSAKSMEARNAVQEIEVSGIGKFVIYLSFILILPIFYAISRKNYIVKLNNKVKETHASIDIALTKRFNVFEVAFNAAKKYLQHENDVFTSVTKARAAINGPQGGNINDKQAMISESIGKFNMVSENYPELKASSIITQFNEQVSEIEEQIVNTRRFYNSSVQKFNTIIKQFPMNVYASMVKDPTTASGGLTTYPLFEADDNKRNNPMIGADGKAAMEW